MGVWKSIFNNTCKPKGLLGVWMVTGMNHAHAALGDWGIRHLPETGFDQIVELGCGGGRNVKALLRRYPAARITALDYAQIAVEKTKRTMSRRYKRAVAVSSRGMFPGCLLGIGSLTWRLHLRRYTFGQGRWKAFGKYIGF